MIQIPLDLAEANLLVQLWHRHHQPVQGHRFSIGAVKDGRLVGAVIVGRTVARASHSRFTCEVTRLVTDGTPNACSFLYGGAARAAKEMGFARIQTYTLDTETGVSLKAAGWEYEGPAGGGQWVHSDGKPRRTDQPTSLKGRWAKRLGVSVAFILPETAPDYQGVLL